MLRCLQFNDHSNVRSPPEQTPTPAQAFRASADITAALLSAATAGSNSSSQSTVLLMKSLLTKSIRLMLVAAFIVGALGVVVATSYEDARDQAAQIVSGLKRADYEGNQTAMQSSYERLAPFLESKELASRIHYWRGFAQWRRAINGFNDAVDPTELENDLKLALDEFKASLQADPVFVEAKIGMVSSLGYLAFMNMKDQERAKELVGQIMLLVKEAAATAPDNPRLIWVQGPILWNTPPERGGGQDKAIANYLKGLEIRSKLEPGEDVLEPSWGKPELMMSLAYSYLNKRHRDLNAAERNARSALEIVPYWHYVRDILLRQILDAKGKEQSSNR